MQQEGIQGNESFLFVIFFKNIPVSAQDEPQKAQINL